MPTTRSAAQHDGTLRELAYRSRHAWVSTKERLGLSRRNDKTFYVEQFARMLQSGAIGPNCSVTAHARIDGAGAQAQALMSAIAFAQAHRLQYVHRPFVSIAHAETDMASWVHMCEEHFNLGAGEPHIAMDGPPVVALENLKFVPADAPVIASAEHYMRYCNFDSEAWERAQPLLRAKFWQNKTPRRSTREVRVAIHMRRGDVSAEDKKVARNFTPNATFVHTLELLKALVGARLPLHVEIFSQGEPEMFADLAARGATLRLNEPALDTHRALVEADILVMSKGAFSYTAGLLNEGIVLYDRQKYRPVNPWIVRDENGSFDNAHLTRQLAPLLARV